MIRGTEGLRRVALALAELPWVIQVFPLATLPSTFPVMQILMTINSPAHRVNAIVKMAKV
jgi:hypothetical protein